MYDPVLLYVVLANIIRNAFSYTHQGTVHIHLKDDRVVIDDTGSGTREDQMLKNVRLIILITMGTASDSRW